MKAATHKEKEMLTTQEACEHLGVGRTTLLKLYRRYKFKRFCTGQQKLLGRTVPKVVRYRRADLDRILELQSKALR